MSKYQINLERIKKIANDLGYVLNSDQERVKKVVEKIATNFESYGDYFCPCKQKNQPPVIGVDVACPCQQLKDEIQKQGHCHCRLFFSPENALK